MGRGHALRYSLVGEVSCLEAFPSGEGACLEVFPSGGGVMP